MTDQYGNPTDPYGQRPQEYSLDSPYGQVSPPGDGYYGQDTHYDPRQYTAIPYENSGYGTQQMQNGMGVASLVLGISTIVTSWCCYFMAIAVPTGVLAIVFGSIGLQRANRGEANNRSMAMAGLVCGAIGLVLGVVMMLLLLGLGITAGY